MTRLIAPIGHSRLNLLAAIERVKPDEVLIILGKDIHQISELTVRTATANSKLIVDVENVDNMFDIAKMKQQITKISKFYPPKEDDIVLLSGSTNACGIMCWLIWGKRSLSLPPGGLLTEINGVEEEHHIDKEKMLEIFGFKQTNEIITHKGMPIFPGAIGSIINEEEGNFKIIWEIQTKDDGWVDYKKMRGQIMLALGLIASGRNRYGAKTFFHEFRGPESGAKLIPEYYSYLIQYNAWGEEE